MAELTIKVVSGASESLHVEVPALAQTTVRQLKQLVEQQDARRFPVPAQRLIFQGQILQDDKLLTAYHVEAGCALHLTLNPRAVAAANTAAPTASAAAPAPAPTPAPASTSTPASAPTQLRSYLQQMQQQETAPQYTTAVQTLRKICENIAAHPTEDKYRKLRVGNAALRNKLFDRVRGVDCVKLLGFQDGVQPDHLVLVPTPEKWENLLACKAVVDTAAASASSPFGAAPSMPGMGGMGAMGGGDFAAQAQTLLQNPGMLQSMASNPMVQQMAQQNPMLAQVLQNPAMLTQSLQALQQNPAMMQQMNQMMSDPSAMARMQQMMAGGGLGGGLGGAMGGGSPFGAPAPASAPAAANPFAGSGTASPFAASTPTPSAAPTAPTAPTAPATASNTAPPSTESAEEDEIAEAIARSLQDQ